MAACETYLRLVADTGTWLSVRISKMVAGTACSDRVDCRCGLADHAALSPETVLAVAKSPL